MQTHLLENNMVRNITEVMTLKVITTEQNFLIIEIPVLWLTKILTESSPEKSFFESKLETVVKI